MIFKSLLKRFKKQDELEIPIHGLSPDEQIELQSLRTTPGWTIYLKLIDSAIDHYARAMLNTSNDADVHCFRGLVLGLEHGPILVDSIINKENVKDERQRHHERITDQRTQRIASLYGTSHWFDQRTG